jgi:hypothetical protein
VPQPDSVALVGADARSNKKWSAGLGCAHNRELNGGTVMLMLRLAGEPEGNVTTSVDAVRLLLDELVMVSSSSIRPCLVPAGERGAMGR